MKNKDTVIVKRESTSVILVWECKACKKIHRCYPVWHEENGTPSCECGDDMTFKHTEISLKGFEK